MAEFSIIGKSVPNVDALQKATGQAMYTNDVSLPRMLYAKILRSPHPHARIISIDASKAERLAGVKVVVTGKDAPDERIYILRDRYILARDVVRFIGEPVAAVAADTIETAEEALDLIEVDYEALPAIFDPEQAMDPNPPVVIHPDFPYVSQFEPGKAQTYLSPFRFPDDPPNFFSHAKVRKGDIERGFQESDLIVEERYNRPRVQHCQPEPNAAVVRPEPDGGLTVWETSQSIYVDREELCRLFKLSPSKVRVIGPYQGGGFGSRSSGQVIATYIAALLALKAGRAVKLVFTRDELFVDGVTEIPMVIYMKDGVKRDGTLVAREVRIILNSGAYSGINVIGSYLAGYAMAYTYRVPNFKYDGYTVATNEPVSGPFRGFAANPPIWAVECHMDLIAERLGIDPVEIRRKNVLKEGEENAIGETTYNIQIEDSMNKVLEWIQWDKEPQVEEGPWRKGKGIALSNKQSDGMHGSAVIVKVYYDGTIEVRHSAADLGQGCNTCFAQIAAEEFVTSVDKVKIVFADTAITPYDFGSIANRVTFHTGNAVRLACQDAKRQILERAAVMLMVSPVALNIRDGIIYKEGTTVAALKISDLFKMPDKFLPKDGEILGRGAFTCNVIPQDRETGQSERANAFYSWGACAAEVAVNVETGEVKVLRVGQSFDMGQPINPKICEGNTEGGIGMGIGSALYEEMSMENGVVLNPNLVDYKVPSIMEIPVADIKAMFPTTVPHREGPFGAKGFAEGGLVPTPPAIANAVYNAVGVRIKELPITRERVLAALEALKEEKEKGKTGSSL